ncbi:MAG: efflux RND transporter periplasmic adaptor subunit [Anaerolineales bacterium]
MKRALIITLLVVLSVGGYFGYQFFTSGQEEQTAQAAVETIEVDTGILVSTVDATGDVRTGQTASLYWGTTGTVSEVKVSVGDQVNNGDVLATLEQSSLPQNVILAEKDLVDAQQALSDIYTSHDSLALAEAEKAVADAQEAVEEAERYLNNLNAPAAQTNIDQAEAALTMAEDKLKKAQEEWTPWANKPEDNVKRAVKKQALAEAQQEYDTAVREYNGLLGSANETDLYIAEADLELAREEFVEAQEEYERLLAGPDSDEIAAAEARIAAAEATLSQAWIETPFEGTITQVDAMPGDQVNVNTGAFRLDDLSALYVDVMVSEIDVNQVVIGQEVSLTFNAIRAKTYHGEVVEVGIIGDDTAGVVSYPVTVRLTDADSDIRPGMTADVEIVVTQETESLLIPNPAIRVENGVQVVYVMDATGSTQPVEIKLGVSSDMMSQVLGGDLRAGDEIVLNPVDEAPEMDPEGMFGGRGNGPFGGGQ